jgi:hypothetical protein
VGPTIEEDIGQMAGAIWYALNTHGELSLARLKKLVEGKGPMFEWAIGWLARGPSCANPQEALTHHPPEIGYLTVKIAQIRDPNLLKNPRANHAESETCAPPKASLPERSSAAQRLALAREGLWKQASVPET